MAGRLKDKVAVATGIASGIGSGTAITFASEGATVVGVDINVDGATQVASIARDRGLDFDLRTPVDLLDEDAVHELMKTTAERYGGIDILVSAAAVVEFAWTPDMTLAQWRKTMVGELTSSSSPAAPRRTVRREEPSSTSRRLPLIR